VQWVLAEYDLAPGDVVRIDTGTYDLESNIEVGPGDEGSSEDQVVFESSPYGVVQDRGDTGSGNYVWHITCSYVTVRTGTSSAHPGVGQSWLRVRGGQMGFYISGQSSLVEGVEVEGNGIRGIYIGNAYGTVRNCVVRDNADDGIYLSSAGNCTLENNTISGNGDDQLYTSSSAGLTLRNNIFCADGSGAYAVYHSYGTLSSDHNLFHVTGGAQVGYYQGAHPELADWRQAMGQDAHSLEEDPQFVNEGAGDYHLKSTAGSYHDGAWTADGTNSPGIDAGYGDAGSEPVPNSTSLQGLDTGKRNLGAYGGTQQGSKTAGGRQLQLHEPIGGEDYLEQSTPVEIRWSWVGTNWTGGDTVNLEYSSDGGVSWSGISGGSAVVVESGSYSWDISGLAAGPFYRVRITSNQDASGRVAASSTRQ